MHTSRGRITVATIAAAGVIVAGLSSSKSGTGSSGAASSASSSSSSSGDIASLSADEIASEAIHVFARRRVSGSRAPSSTAANAPMPIWA